MLLVRRGLFLRRRLGGRSPAAAIEANPRHARIVDHSLIVDIRDRDAAEVADGPIVSKLAIAPASALVTNAAVAEAVVDATVKADVRSPIAAIEKIDAI